jgi:hypothetical protein
LVVFGVVRVRSLTEAVAVGLMVMLARAVVGLVTWKVFRVIPLAKPSRTVPVVGFGSHCV